MAEPTPAPPPQPTVNAVPKAPSTNPALRILGLPNLPKKLPSRNWMIFWTVSTAIAAAIIYDKREKKRNIAKWRHAVEHLANEPLPSGSFGLAQPRKLTIYLSAPPGDSLRSAQDHYTEYVKPILAASGLDWEFVQGRREGDIRAYVAERIRRVRRSLEGKEERDPTKPPSKEEIVEEFRKSRGIRDYDGIRGDIVIGRHTWKEYLRGLHEADYPSSPLPPHIPPAFHPTAPIREPHLLGFLNTPIRLYRYFNRRKLADDIGREVAAVCLCTYREFRQLQANPDSTPSDNEPWNQPAQYEQQAELAWEEKDWVKSVWKEADQVDPEVPEKVRPKPIVMDPRIAIRMRRFALTPADEERVSRIIVPEEEVEGWIKGNLRALYRWGYQKAFVKEKRTPLEDKDVD
ncbi:uncharacterized protein CTHT_0034980 [Thermochaetoides thermophila DSM 1495]|uniref:Mitochondrial import inner membrane translocase subunit TIM54 n=1 Tax=Chaetomium thermophilum (strain DSM 1495 / CBS 144.50 / IMI 039719) TaxID=759272 RepID=G0S6N2_CHATD|nr:hypothetical protein CTHT_0034980 [Thermochaetoides thermophila DSM 1495]EGS21634.1 hypothetical protein CTHT_0034980 [Thermochaetoides thermophila DSM 1495]